MDDGKVCIRAGFSFVYDGFVCDGKAVICADFAIIRAEKPCIKAAYCAGLGFLLRLGQMKREELTQMLNRVNKPYYQKKEIEEPMYDDSAMIVCPDVRIKYENKAARPNANIIRVFTERWIR